MERTGTGIDWPIVAIYFSLLSIGLMMIYAVTFTPGGENSFFDFSTRSGKQFIFAVTAALVFSAALLIDRKFWNIFAYPIYLASILLLIAVLFLGKEINGIRAWFSLGWFSFQPSEFAKLATTFVLCNYLSGFTVQLKEFRQQITVIGIILLPVCFILLQPDAGSAIVFFSLFIMLYREGFPSLPFILGISLLVLMILSYLYQPFHILTITLACIILVLILSFRNRIRWGTILGIIIAGSILGYQFAGASIAFGILLGGFLIACAFLWKEANYRAVVLALSGMMIFSIMVYSADYFFDRVLEPHQRDRINVWLKPGESDPFGPLYNVLQSQMAIASGGFYGKGYLQGTMTKLNYVPEQETDFIFCTIGEEQGFLGSFAVLILFALLIYRLLFLAERQRNAFHRMYMYAIAGIIFIHVVINVGMTIGLFPVIGIPLPLISYGGSSLIFFSLMLGIALKMDLHRNES